MKPEQNKYINRELSWLEFNQRVLEEARRPGVPLLERLKFLAISASNLDEFFMVRVGGLQLMRKAGRRRRDPSGMTPVQQLRAISKRAHEMVQEQYTLYQSELQPQLALEGIERVRPHEYTTDQQRFIQHFFEEELFAIVTPTGLAAGKPFPLLKNLGLSVIVRLAPKEAGDADDYAILPLSPPLNRFLTMPADSGYRYMLLEDVMSVFAARWFPGRKVRECATIRIARNADMSVREDEAFDLLTGMQGVLNERRHSACVRLEIEDKASTGLLTHLRKTLDLATQDIYRIPGPLNLKDFMFMAFMEGFGALRDDAWPPQVPAMVDPRSSMFEQIAARDLLVCHPYDSFEPVVRFIEEASADPDVLAIKQILYRTSSDSPIVEALARAAESGKNVTALVELKARFDEERNIYWAQRLEERGVQVIHGVRGLKTHAKICIVVRREAHGLVRYMHFGTGNYNESTARLYSDVGVFTCNPAFGQDAASFFNAICGYSEPPAFLNLVMAPMGIRLSLLEHIDAEIERCRQGDKARIMLKANALVDQQIIERLYAASAAGVKVLLNIRGICCLRAGVPGLSENIRVVSIIDRFLEHARIYNFRHGGREKVFISSADLMPRNLDKRVELLVPIDDAFCRKKALSILKTYFKDATNSWILTEDNTWMAPEANPTKAFRSQKKLYDKACERAQEAQHQRRTRFEPHRAGK